MPKSLCVTASAKLNLHLHIVGKREDGYHLLESLICFTSIHDIIHITPSDTLQCSVTGGFASSIDDETNIVELAAKKLAIYEGISPDVHITIEKNIPVGAGLGGGSSDAAAVLLALTSFWNIDITTDALMQIGLELGADVPIFLHQKAAFVEGIGEILSPAEALPNLSAVLVNPAVHLSTPQVFKQGVDAFSPVGSKAQLDKGTQNIIPLLQQWHNDLEAPAIQLAPVIQEVRDSIANQEGCMLSRMSGSGSTCFGLFADEETAQTAAQIIQARYPKWWVRPTTLMADIAS